MIHYALLAWIVVLIIVIGEHFVRPTLADEVADSGTTSFTGALIVLAVVFLSMIRDRRISNIERMVKAIYDHLDLDDDRRQSDDKNRHVKSHGRDGTSDGDADARVDGGAAHARG